MSVEMTIFLSDSTTFLLPLSYFNGLKDKQYFLPYHYISYYYPMVYLDLKHGGARIEIVDRIRK